MKDFVCCDTEIASNTKREKFNWKSLKFLPSLVYCNKNSLVEGNLMNASQFIGG